MIAFDEALAIVVAHARPRAVEEVGLATAAGRVLAAPCVAGVDSPPATVSAMDGYALRDEDLATGEPLHIVGAAYPGAPFDGSVARGECVRIFTGAPVPAGAERVAVQEEVRREGDQAHLLAPSPGRRHIRTQGSDFRVGETLLPAGRLLDPRAMVAAAATDLARLSVWRRPRLSVVATGDELAAPGSARTHRFGIPESASFGAAALAEAWGGAIVGRHRLRDDLAELTAGATRALDEADIVIVTGGASVGERDYARRVFAGIGAQPLFAKVAMMPGKPVWFAQAGERLVLGLPGNPGSAMVTARLFLAPLLAGMTGRDPHVALRWRRARLASPLGATADRETFVRARQGEDGVSAVGNQDSGAQLALADADVLIRRAPGSATAVAGSEVEVLDF